MEKPVLGMALSLALCAPACSGGDPVKPAEAEKPTAEWAKVTNAESAALMSVHGTAADDVWMVGADDGRGPLVLHYDGEAWERRETGVRGDLWWIHATKDGPVFFGGSDALMLRFEDGKFERLRTPGLGKNTVYGIYAASPTDVYAVGSSAGRNGFIWHFDGVSFENVPLPDDVAQDEYRDIPAFFKVWGTSPEDIWVVGGTGTVLRGNAKDGFRRIESGTDALLFTAHAGDDRVVIVGGAGEGVVLEAVGDKLVDRTPEGAPLLQGACVDDKGTAWAVGMSGSIYRAKLNRFRAIDTGIDMAATHSLHATWADPEGGVWAVGGDVLTPALESGVGLHLGTRAIPEVTIDPPPKPPAVCPEAAIDPHPESSIARRWDEQILNAIRRDTPRPTVHARNLFHFSIALWDAWAAYDAAADGYLSDERLDVSALDDHGLDAARQEAISYAAYRVLSHRYGKATGGAVSQACFDAFMNKLGYDAADTAASGDGARALGNRIGAAIIAKYANDGANEEKDYAAADGLDPNNPNLVVDIPGTKTTNPLEWQKLVLARAETQNGIPAGSGAQPYIGPQWGGVEPFALVRPSTGAAYVDIGAPPQALDGSLVDDIVEILQKSANLDTHDGAMIDISPGAIGNNPLGSNAGTGHATNPVTGEPYPPRRVKRADFGRVLAEFWADGPTSETPPGHWNTIANHVSENGRAS
jgi:hypothetical protein